MSIILLYYQTHNISIKYAHVAPEFGSRTRSCGTSAAPALREKSSAKGHTLKIDPSFYGQITGRETQELGEPALLLRVFIFYGDVARQWGCAQSVMSEETLEDQAATPAGRDRTELIDWLARRTSAGQRGGPAPVTLGGMCLLRLHPPGSGDGSHGCV